MRNQCVLQPDALLAIENEGMSKEMSVTILATAAELKLDIFALRESRDGVPRLRHKRPGLLPPPAKRRRRRERADQAYRPAVGKDQRIPVLDRRDRPSLRCGEMAGVGGKAFGAER